MAVKDKIKEISFFNLRGIKISYVNPYSLKNYLKDIILDNLKPLQILTFNTDYLYNACRNNAFYETCLNSDIVFPDGAGILYLLKIKYGIKPQRITGNALMYLLLELADELKLSVSFVGSSDSVLHKIHKKISEEYPEVIVKDLISPPDKFEYNEALNKNVINRLKSSSPDILFVALGSPRQDIWIRSIKKEIGAKVSVGVGAAFNYFAGKLKRAPLPVRRAGFEWLWRFAHEPGRLFKRYFINDLPFFIKESIKLALLHDD